MDPRTPVVVAARRTPVATAGRALAARDAAGLAAPVLRALSEDLGALGADGRVVDDVVLGNCCGPGGDVARVAALAAGLGVDVPAVTVDRQCGAGLEAVRLAAALVRSGEADVVLAGGTESASHARDGGARAPFTPPGWPDPEMGAAADDLAAKAGVSRERQDAYAARSHRLVVAAAGAGVFDDEIVEVDGVRRDDRPRPRLDAGMLARMPAAFTPGGTATAGNSCGINDGAAACGRRPGGAAGPRGRAGSADRRDGRRGGRPGPAGAGAGARRPRRPAAGRPDARRRRRGRDHRGVRRAGAGLHGRARTRPPRRGRRPRVPRRRRDRAGHPWGASGALLVVRLFSSLVRRRRGRYGVATCAVGGGQGVAVVVEVVT